MHFVVVRGTCSNSTGLQGLAVAPLSLVLNACFLPVCMHRSMQRMDHMFQHLL